MNKLFKFILVCYIGFSSIILADEKKDLEVCFLKKINQVVSVTKDTNLSKEQRNIQILKILSPIFDFELMARLSLGKRFKQLSDEDKDRFVNIYVKRMENSYSSKLDSYSNEKVEVKEVKQPKNTRIYIITDLVTGNDKLEIIYKFYKPKEQLDTKHGWLIYDIEILGVSILKTNKIQFKEFLQTKTIYELMDLLETKNG